MSEKSESRSKDTGMAMVLLLLLIAHFMEIPGLLGWAIGVLVLVMVWPPLFAPLATVWFSLSHVLGTLGSKILLTLVFAFIATPVGLVRRLFGADSMRLKEWGRGQGSVMRERNHVYLPEDLERPY